MAQDVVTLATQAKKLSRLKRPDRNQRRTLERVVRRLAFATGVDQHLDGYPDLIEAVQAARQARTSLSTVMA